MDYFGEDRALSTIGREDVEGYVKHAEKVKKWKPGTIDRHLSALGKMLNLAVNVWKELKHAPAMPYFHDKTHRLFVLTDKQEESLLAATAAYGKTRPGPKGGFPRKDDGADYADLFTVLIDVGMRLGEAFRIRQEDIVWPEKEGGNTYLRFWRGAELKGGRERMIPTTERVTEVLKRRQHLPGGPFAGLSQRRAQRLWQRAKGGAGITSRDCVPHSSRHTCATRLLEATRDIKLVQEWVGHASMNTTAAVYAKVQTHRFDAAVAELAKQRKRGT